MDDASEPTKYRDVSGTTCSYVSLTQIFDEFRPHQPAEEISTRGHLNCPVEPTNIEYIKHGRQAVFWLWFKRSPMGGLRRINTLLPCSSAKLCFKTTESKEKTREGDLRVAVGFVDCVVH
jgi:hypothetical protein